MRETTEFIDNLKSFNNVVDINLFQYKPYPGTELYNDFFSGINIEYIFEDILFALRGNFIHQNTREH